MNPLIFLCLIRQLINSSVADIGHVAVFRFVAFRFSSFSISSYHIYPYPKLIMSSRNSNNNDQSEERVLPENVRRRMRSVADREAARLARPDRQKKSGIGHASRMKSAVSSTPFGFDTFKRNISIDDESNVQENGGDWCGPFSVARQMIAARDEARRKRNEENEKEDEPKESHPLDVIYNASELEKKRKANPSMTWKAKTVQETDWTGKKQNLYYKRQKRYAEQERVKKNKIPTLYEMCLSFITENFEYVESLGPFVDAKIRKDICTKLVSTGMFNGAAFDTLAEVGVETLEITDCTEVTQDQLSEALKDLIPNGLKALLLTHCGRCFGKRAVDAIVKASDGPNGNEIFALSIFGAYVLKDEDAARLLQTAKNGLSSIEFKACHLLGDHFCKQFAKSFVTSLNPRNVLLELSLQDLNLNKEHLKIIAESGALGNLKSLSLSLGSLDDDSIANILEATDGNLENLNLNNNVNLTDETLSLIRQYNVKGKLKSLRLNGIKNFTSAGLETFFTFNIKGLPNPPALRTLDLSECDYDSVNEQVIEYAITASALKQTLGDKVVDEGVDTIKRKTDLSAMGGLVSLDVSGSSVNDKNMEQLAALCSKTLMELKLNFCPLVSDSGLGYLVDKCGRQLTTIEIWGNAQVSNKFLDGHCRVGKGLIVEGAWMKNSEGKGSQR